MTTVQQMDDKRQVEVAQIDYFPADIAEFPGTADPGAEQKRSAKDKQPSFLEDTFGLGIDEEISVKRRVREPRVKLDESRLLSKKGIPSLREQARNIKLKGKGHEFSDAARLLSIYQLWLDDLFPKAQFGDALAMVEKEGHRATMHKMRMEWINESKPRSVQGQSDEAVGIDLASEAPTNAQLLGQLDGQRTLMELPSEDLGDLPDHPFSIVPSPGSRQMQDSPLHMAQDFPDEDMLDELMAEAAAIHSPQPSTR